MSPGQLIVHPGLVVTTGAAYVVVLLELNGSLVLLETVAVLAIKAPCVAPLLTLKTYWMLAVPPALSEPIVQVVPLRLAQSEETKVVLAGTGTVSVTPCAASGPWLSIWMT
jgi:hypothetical protein